MFLSGIQAYQAYFEIQVNIFCYADSLQEIHLFHDKVPIFETFTRGLTSYSKLLITVID